jgi:predicted nucleic acid-binding protein
VRCSSKLPGSERRTALPCLDAIHVATALAASCDVFLTNDRRLKVPPDLSRHLI